MRAGRVVCVPALLQGLASGAACDALPPFIAPAGAALVAAGALMPSALFPPMAGRCRHQVTSRRA